MQEGSVKEAVQQLPSEATLSLTGKGSFDYADRFASRISPLRSG